jgi:molecular chaperone DnaK
MANYTFDRTIGIDLGTTNSEVAWLHPSEREVVIYTDKFGRRTVPSALAWDPKSKAILVGYPARAQRMTAFPPLESVKRSMGETRTFAVGNETLSPEQASSYLLRDLRAKIQSVLEQKAQLPGLEAVATRAVITVPAYFDAPQVQATKTAGELAGLEVVGILQEPTAAAIYHAYRNPKIGQTGTYLVYDLGGGTFDVSIIRATAGEYQVVAIDGDNLLGGDDFDRAYAEVLRQALVGQGYKLDLDPRDAAEDRLRLSRLMNVAQEIKESLSTVEILSFAKADIGSDQNGEVVALQMDIARADYEQCIAPLVRRTMDCLNRALAESLKSAQIGRAQIDHVLMVGGSTRVPLVQAELRAYFAGTQAQFWNDDVDTCVALGAALYGAGAFPSKIVGREVGSAHVSITGPLAAKGEVLEIGIEVIGEKRAECKSLVIWAGEDVLGETMLIGKSGGDRMQLSLPEGDAIATLALQSRLGMPLEEIPLPLFRSDLRPRPTVLTRASVLAKEIGVEVLRGGRRARRIVLPKGAPLPCRKTDVLYTGDETGAVVLRLLQGHLLIKTISIEVPQGTRVGTPFELTLLCDEAMQMQAQAQIAGHSVQVSLEASAFETPDAEALATLLAETEEAGRLLWGNYGLEFRTMAERLVALLREAGETDPSRVPALASQLRSCIEAYRGQAGDALIPPLGVFERSLTEIRRVVHAVKGDLLGSTRESWEKRVEALEVRGRKVYDAGNAAGWKRINDELQALSESVRVAEWSKQDINNPDYIRRRLLGLAAGVAEVIARLRDFASVASDASGTIRAKEKARIEEWIERDVQNKLARITPRRIETEPGECNVEISTIYDELERVEMAVDRLPSIGLLTERDGDAS